jgi:hypothetical protein
MSPLKPAFNALFRNGHLTKEIDLGMTIDKVKKLDKKMFDAGFRIRLLYRYWSDGSYQVAWEEGGGAQLWMTTDDFDEFKNQDKKEFDKGMRLKYLHSSVGYFTAIWHGGIGGQHWEANISFDKFKAKDEEMRGKGYILMQFCDDGGSYSGFWQPGKSDYSWISTDDLNGFNESITINKAGGRLGVSFGGEQFCAVFHADIGDQRFLHGLFEKDFRNQSEELFKQNFHIVDLYMTAGI